MLIHQPFGQAESCPEFDKRVEKFIEGQKAFNEKYRITSMIDLTHPNTAALYLMTSGVCTQCNGNTTREGHTTACPNHPSRHRPPQTS